MRALLIPVALAVACAAGGAEPDDARVKNLFQSDDYTVTWGTAPAYPQDAELEIGDGNGHGFTLRWLRFTPDKDAVGVLSVELDEGFHRYVSKWPPDRAPVTVRHARQTRDAYAALLRDLAVVGSAKLKRVERNSI